MLKGFLYGCIGTIYVVPHEGNHDRLLLLVLGLLYLILAIGEFYHCRAIRKWLRRRKTSHRS